MKISFRLGPEDYYDAFQASTTKNRRIAGIAALAMAALGTVVLFRAPQQTGGHPFLGMALFWFVLLGSFFAFGWFLDSSYKRSLRKASRSGADKEIVLDISDSGMESAEPPQKDEWSHFSKYLESANSFILYEGPSIYAILPKRAFAPTEIDAVRRILDARLPKH